VVVADSSTRYLQGVAKKYSLDALRRVRAERVQSKTNDLAEALRRVTDSQRSVEAQERASGAFEADCREANRHEQQRLEAGQLLVRDLMQAATWAAGIEAERQQQAQELALAKRSLEQAAAISNQQRAMLAQARTDAEINNRDRSRWEHAQDLERCKADDEEAEENHRSGMSTRGEK
jgi:hypothetical protein